MKEYPFNIDDVIYRDGRYWITCDCLAYGDYDKSCAVERSNVRLLLNKHKGYINGFSYRTWDLGVTTRYDGSMGFIDEPIKIDIGVQVIELTGDFSSTRVWLLWTDENDDILRGLLDYPCIDDEDVSFLEMEMELDDWASWIKSDLLKAAYPDNDEREEIEEIDDDALYDCYLQAKEQENAYYEVQTGGIGWIDVTRIASAFKACVTKGVN